MRVLLGATALIAAVHGVAWACTCIPDTGTPAEHLADHRLVFWGEVTARASTRSFGCRAPSAVDTVDVEIQVIEPFAGVELGEIVTVRTARDSAACGVPFGVGERWLVFAHPDERTSLCGPSHRADPDDPELAALRAMGP